MAYIVAANMVYDALSATYTHGVDVKICLDDVTDFPIAPGGVVYIDDGTEWVLQRYSVVDVPNDELETLANPVAVFASAGAGGHVFQIATEVKLVRAADYCNQMITDITGAPAGAIFYEDTDEIGSSASLTFDGTTFKCDKAAIFNESGADVDFRIEGVGAPNAFFVQGSNGKVGFGIAIPVGYLHLLASSACGVVWNAAFDDAIFEKDGAMNIQVGTANDQAGSISFSDADARNRGQLRYMHNGDYMQFYTAGVEAARIDDVMNFALGTTTIDGAAAKSFTVSAGTAPGAHTDNQAYLWVEDVNAAAGFAGFHMMGENGAGSIKQIVVGVVIKGTAGQTANPHEGLIEINTNDNSLKMYAEGAWRDIAAGW